MRRQAVVIINQKGEIFIENPATAESVLIAPRLTPCNENDAEFIRKAVRALENKQQVPRR